MIFETLWDSSKRGELLLIDGGLCHWHLRKDGQITIREIISQKKGNGKTMLNMLIDKNPLSIFAKCPAELDSNGWYEKMGFSIEGQSESRTGKKINHWRLTL